MSYHQGAGNGRHGGGPPHQPQPWHAPPQPPHGPTPAITRGGMVDLAKGGLSITLVGGALLVMLQAGMAIGSYMERGATMQKQLDELKADVREIKAMLPDLKAMVKQALDRPQWHVSVEKRAK